MTDFKKYNNQLLRASKALQIDEVINSYELPKSEEIHNMIYNYFECDKYSDIKVFDCPQSIDYFKYEKELCKTNKTKL